MYVCIYTQRYIDDVFICLVVANETFKMFRKIFVERVAWYFNMTFKCHAKLKFLNKYPVGICIIYLALSYVSV